MRSIKQQIFLLFPAGRHLANIEKARQKVGTLNVCLEAQDWLGADEVPAELLRTFSLLFLRALPMIAFCLPVLGRTLQAKPDIPHDFGSLWNLAVDSLDGTSLRMRKSHSCAATFDTAEVEEATKMTSIRCVRRNCPGGSFISTAMTKGRQVLLHDNEYISIANHIEQWNELGALLMDIATVAIQDGSDAQCLFKPAFDWQAKQLAKETLTTVLISLRSFSEENRDVIGTWSPPLAPWACFASPSTSNYLVRAYTCLQEIRKGAFKLVSVLTL